MDKPRRSYIWPQEISTIYCPQCGAGWLWATEFQNFMKLEDGKLCHCEGDFYDGGNLFVCDCGEYLTKAGIARTGDEFRFAYHDLLTDAAEHPSENELYWTALLMYFDFAALAARAQVEEETESEVILRQKMDHLSLVLFGFYG